MNLQFVGLWLFSLLCFAISLFSNECTFLWNLPEVTQVKSYDNDIMLMTNAINTHVLKLF